MSSDWKLADHPRRYVLIPDAAPDPDERRPLLRRWRALPRSPHLLEERGAGDELAVEDVEWGLPKVPLGPRVASIGVMMTHLFDGIAAWEADGELGWFACPFVKLDRYGWPRIGFWPPTHTAELAKRVAPEVIEHWPRLEEPAMVHAVGRLMMDITTITRDNLRDPVALVIRRCLLDDPARRFPSLQQLRTTLVEKAGAAEMRIVLRKLAEANERPAPRREPKTSRTWPDIAAAGARLEAKRNPRGALAIYLSIDVGDVHRVPHLLALARASLAAGDHGQAIDFATRLAPSRESLAIEAKAWIAKREHGKALDAIARWEAFAPDDAAVPYQRGKALLGLGRLPEARAAFDHALARDGKMIEAMLLRREVDRHMGAQRAIAGTQQQPALSPELVALIGAEPGAAIDALSAPRFEADAVAQLMLAELLAAEQRYADALLCYDRAAPELPQARRGKARALLELGRSDEALAALGDATDIATVEMRAWIAARS